MEDDDKLIQLYQDNKLLFELFLNNVRTYFEKCPTLNATSNQVIHSIKSRLKDPEHLRDKLKRKRAIGEDINEENYFSKITDFAGVRILHLYQDQFAAIYSEIRRMIEIGEWRIIEAPVAYTWDPEAVRYFQSLGIDTQLKESYYTSIHITIGPNNEQSIACCEIQIRTLFEEIWGEIDHAINYPHKTDSVACREQLRVLAKLVSTGTRLADAIFRSYEDYKTVEF